MTSDTSKKRRIMILTADDDIIDQIQRTNDPLLVKKLILQSEINNTPSPNVQLNDTRSQSIKPGTLTCVVCKSPANGYNFGAIACESCKTFFRRNALKTSTALRCRYKGNCEMNSETRRSCPACRLVECYKQGMKSDRILTNEQKLAKRRKLEENRNLTLITIPTATTNERQCQTSPAHSFDDAIHIPDIVLPQQNSVTLTLDELQRIADISLYYQKRIELANLQGLPFDPSLERTNFLDLLNSFSVSILRLLSFFKQIPEFNQLNLDDKVILTKYNLLIVSGISCALSFDVKSGQIIETNSDLPWNMDIYRVVFGYKTCKESQKIFGIFLNIANRDQKIILLLLVVLILTKGYSIASSCEPILTNEIAVHQVQNSYTELLWKYLEANYKFEESVRLYSRLICGAISWQAVQDDMRNSILRILSPEDIEKLVPFLRSVWYLP